jgi:hypothetical protein
MSLICPVSHVCPIWLQGQLQARTNSQTLTAKIAELEAQIAEFEKSVPLEKSVPPTEKDEGEEAEEAEEKRGEGKGGMLGGVEQAPLLKSCLYIYIYRYIYPYI